MFGKSKKKCGSLRELQAAGLREAAVWTSRGVRQEDRRAVGKALLDLLRSLLYNQVKPNVFSKNHLKYDSQPLYLKS